MKTLKLMFDFLVYDPKLCLSVAWEMIKEPFMKGKKK